MLKIKPKRYYNNLGKSYKNCDNAYEQMVQIMIKFVQSGTTRIQASPQKVGPRVQNIGASHVKDWATRYYKKLGTS